MLCVVAAHDDYGADAHADENPHHDHDEQSRL
jgi:hypothetical protein